MRLRRGVFRKQIWLFLNVRYCLVYFYILFRGWGVLTSKTLRLSYGLSQCTAATEALVFNGKSSRRQKKTLKHDFNKLCLLQ